jgi:DNA topoisomerase-3
VGINGTRAMTAFNSRDGGFFLTTVGRVQTPTLAVVVEREEQIRKFISRDYWEIHATFLAEAGEYPAKWFDPAWKKDPEDAEKRADRVWSEREAQAIANAVRGKAATVTEESKPTTQASPLLFDLTSLQREANGKFGFSAKTTLALAQSLYERHKALTYPRTDSRACPRTTCRGQADLRDAGRQRHAAPGAARAHRAGRQLHQAQQAHLRQQQGERPLCHHPHAAGALGPVGSRAEAVRPGGAPLHGGVLPERRIHW